MKQNCAEVETSFHIDGRKWRVRMIPAKRLVQEDSGTGDFGYGICFEELQEIAVACLHGDQFVQNTLIHELVHACTAHFGLAEEIVVVIADRLQGVLRQLGMLEEPSETVRRLFKENVAPQAPRTNRSRPPKGASNKKREKP